MHKHSFLKSACAAALVTAIACSGGEKQASPKKPPQDRKPVIALIMKAISNEFFAEMEKGGLSAAGKLDVDLKALSISRETDFEQQAKLVEQMIAQNVDAIVIAPADSKGIVSTLLRAQKKGIPIINIDNRIDRETAEKAGLKVLTYIGPDNAEGAEKSTDYLIELIGGKGKVAMLEGLRGVDNAEQRKIGFERAVKKTGGAVEIAAMDTADWATDLAEKKMSGILMRHRDLNGVFCANDNMAFGAIAAIESAGLSGKVRVTAYDNLPAAQKAILAGKMAATIEQHPFKMGAMGVEYALKAIKGEEFGDEIPVPTDLITAETLKKKKGGNQ